MSTHHVHQGHHPTLSEADLETLGTVLQSALILLTDLSLLGKQAHWNVQGPNFRPLHLQLDEMIESWREAADVVAERAVALGQAADGRAATVAASSGLQTLPGGPLSDREVVAAFTGLLTDAIGAVREGMDQIEDMDTVTADVLHGVVAGLEQNAWMIRVQAA
jgi:starvation-inducible DNA-binding protein